MFQIIECLTQAHTDITLTQLPETIVKYRFSHYHPLFSPSVCSGSIATNARRLKTREGKDGIPKEDRDPPRGFQLPKGHRPQSMTPAAPAHDACCQCAPASDIGIAHGDSSASSSSRIGAGWEYPQLRFFDSIIQPLIIGTSNRACALISRGRNKQSKHFFLIRRRSEFPICILRSD